MSERLENKSLQLKRTAVAGLVKTLWPIEFAEHITLDTRHKAKQLQEKGKLVPWQEMDSETAINTYLNKAALTLSEGGIVILAPQAGRRNLLTPFKGGPVTRLEQHVRQLGIDDIAYFVVGLEIPGTEDYSKLKGLNVRSKYRVTLGEITTRASIAENIDSWGYQQMLELAPIAYRPQRHV